jgi:hypothetical protein
MKRRLHVLQRETKCFGVKLSTVYVNKKQSALCGVSAQNLNFSRTQRAIAVKVQRQWPTPFIIH